MNIQQVISSADLAHGGVMEGTRQRSVILAQMGHHVEVTSADDPKAPWLRDLGLTAHALGPSKSGYCYAPKMLPWLRENAARFDAVIVNGLWQYPSFAARRALRGTGTPYFVYTHGMLDPWFKRTFPLKHLKESLYWPWGEYRVLRDAQAVLFIGLAPRLLFGLPTDVGPLWYITLFAFGMIAAVLCFSDQQYQQKTGQKVPWGAAAGLFCVLWLGCVVIHLNWDKYRWISELLIGAAAVSLIATYARLLIQGTSRPLPFGLRLLSSRWATALGTFSYSIHLIHFPVIYTADMLLRSLHAPFPIRFAVLFAGAVPLAVALAYLFHLAFERRFMTEFEKPKR